MLLNIIIIELLLVHKAAYVLLWPKVEQYNNAVVRLK